MGVQADPGRGDREGRNRQRAGLFTSSWLFTSSFSSLPIPNLGELSRRVGQGVMGPDLSSRDLWVALRASLSSVHSHLSTCCARSSRGSGAWQLATVGQLHLQGPRSPTLLPGYPPPNPVDIVQSAPSPPPPPLQLQTLLSSLASYSTPIADPEATLRSLRPQRWEHSEMLGMSYSLCSPGWS